MKKFCLCSMVCILTSFFLPLPHCQAQTPVRAGLEFSASGSVPLGGDFTFGAGGMVNLRTFIGSRFSLGIGAQFRRLVATSTQTEGLWYNKMDKIANTYTSSYDSSATFRPFAWTIGGLLMPEVMFGKLVSRFRPFVGLSISLDYCSRGKQFPGMEEYDAKNHKAVKVTRTVYGGLGLGLGAFLGFDVYGKKSKNAFSVKAGYEALLAGRGLIIHLPTIFIGLKIRA